MKINRVVWNIAFNCHVQSLVPILDNTVQVKFYSSSDVSRKERIKNEIPPELIAGFVTCLYEENWWLACGLEVCNANKEVKLTFLHPHGPSSSFKYPEPQNIHNIRTNGWHSNSCRPKDKKWSCVFVDKKEITFATEQLCTISPQ